MGRPTRWNISGCSAASAFFVSSLPPVASGHRWIVRLVCLEPLRMEMITMNRLMTVVCGLRSSGAMTRYRLNFKRASSLLAIASAMAITSAFAREPAVPEAKPINKGQAVRVQGQPEPAATETRSVNRGPATQAHSESAVIPECLEKLNLSAQQQDQVKGIVHNYDGSLRVVWTQFSDRYMQAICMETALMAAIEDNLTEAQRQQVRNQRRVTAQHEKAMAATSTKVNQAKVKPNEETTKPVDAAEEGIAAAGISLTDEQETAADRVQEKYRSQLRSLNRDIQGLHTRLVSLEADKLTEIEKVLTKDQLSQLRINRQNAPVAPKVASSQAEPTKAE